MRAYKILKYTNSILQGQFRKYPSLIRYVANKCVQSSDSLEEAKEVFNQVNLAISRILSTGIYHHDPINIGEDNPSILKCAKNLNQRIDIEQLWMKLKG